MCKRNGTGQGNFRGNEIPLATPERPCKVPALSMKSTCFSLATALFCGATLAAFGADVPKSAAPAAEAPAPEAPAPAKPYLLPPTVATVEGVEIKKDELEKAFGSMLASQGVSPDAVPPAKVGEAYKMILDDLIVEHLISKRAADVKITDTEFAAAFEKFKGNFGSDEELKSQVEKSGVSIEKMKDDMRNNLRAQKWLDAQVKDGGQPTDADAKEFYEKNPQQFQRPERVRASHILLKVEADAKPEAVVAKEKAAAAIAERARKGEDFGGMAKELSEDPSAKQNGGDLDFFTKEQMVPEFSEAAFSMKKDQISDPVRSQFGYHIIKVTDRKEGEKVSLEQVKPQLLAYLQRQKKQEEIGKIIQDIRQKAEVKVNLPE